MGWRWVSLVGAYRIFFRQAARRAQSFDRVVPTAVYFLMPGVRRVKTRRRPVMAAPQGRNTAAWLPRFARLYRNDTANRELRLELCLKRPGLWKKLREGFLGLRSWTLW